MLTPPATPKRPTERRHHGDVVVDEYEWLRDRDDPAVSAHLHEENAYTNARTEHLAVLREQIFDEIKGRTRESDLSVPTREGDWWYYTRTVEGKQYGIHCRAPIAGPDDWEPPALDETAQRSRLPGEQVLLDDNAEAEGHAFYALGSFDVSADGSRLLYAIDTEGDERYTIRVRSLNGDGDGFPDLIAGTGAGALFDQSGEYIFYTTVDDAWRPSTVWRHRVGEGPDEQADATVFHEPDERYWIGVGMTRSRRFLVIEARSNITSETWLLRSDDPTGEFSVVWPRKEGVEYDVEHSIFGAHDRLLLVHNDGAVNFELVSVAAEAPQGKRRMLLPHNPAVRLESVDAFRDFVALEYRRDGLTRIAIGRVPDPAEFAAHPDSAPDDMLHELRFDEELFTVGVGSNPEWTQPHLRLGYTSFVTPPSVYDYDIRSHERVLRKKQAVLGAFDPELFEQKREWATADDGTRIPLSLVYRRDLVTPGEPAPLVLYGYGSYEASIDPSFGIPRLSLLDRGVVFAIAHVRGGGELGRLWYENGKKLHKKNTFTDFVAAAEHLTTQGWTSPDRLAAQGGSAGGLLMGAVANLAPRALAGILAEVPFVDPLTSILDPSLPLTVIEWDEWGDPLHDEDVYYYMKSYAPVENIHATRYPRILAITSLNDTRVLYVEPTKWVATLREAGADALLKTEMTAGHGGVSGRYAAWRERAFALAWLLDVVGVHPSGA
ncbi:protease 2 [Leifsonia xyli subsp. xyli]|uniref:Protease II n=2 Tax=Leifsonia xyli subsp. xyli TaxID=59736 RepID=Q6AH78_LEIXX|nr:S9 family peptidase [Leifsonia xyli]AAT88267.1 protease II [Leifsonia xyli subsp. xyli str. CTCB07]ODA89873.1 protease 2 [Leifsonia xyli subsp. xyli]